MRFLPLLFCCLLSGILPGQTFRAAAVAGVNLSQIDGDDLLGFYQPGFNGGLRVVAVLGERWRLGPELLFSQLGARRNRNSINVSDFDRFRLQTIELPLMLYYKDWRITAEAGVAYQRLVNYTVTARDGSDVTPDYPLRNDLAAIKLGVTLYLTPRIGVNFRWSRHLTDLQQADEPRLRARWLSLRAVYSLGAGESLPDPPFNPE